MDDKSWDSSRKISKKFRNHNIKKIVILIFIFLATLACFSIIGYILLKKPDFHNPCSDDYHFFATSGFCYKTYLPIVTRQNALDHCESEGGSLVSIHSIEESTFVMNLYNLTLEKHRSDSEFNASSETYKFWIGHEYDPYEEEFFWSDGTAHNIDYYMGYEPKPGQIYSVFNTIGNGEWQLVKNSMSASYTCKRSIGATFQKRECSPGFTFVKSTGFCYKVFTSHSTFTEASKQCAKQGSNLITIQSELEHYTIIKLYKKVLIETYDYDSFIALSPLWTGLIFDGNTWKWSDGSPFKWSNFQYKNWNSPREGQYWTAIDIRSSEPQRAIDDKWITVGQPNYFSFVCKKPDTSKDTIVITMDDKTLQTTTPITEVDRSPKTCSKNYEYFEETGFCYSINLKPLNFTKASKNCGKENGHLASIHSREEEQFLLEMAVQQLGNKKNRQTGFYIGLIYTNNRWEWTDGTPVNYVHWSSEEPNFLLFEKWTTMIHRGSSDLEWNNINGDEETNFICKKNPQ